MGLLTRKETKEEVVDEGFIDRGPPDGGMRAWLQVLCGHLIVFNAWGYINSFGIFQPYYVSMLNRPPSDISWVGSLQICLVYGVGTFSGRAMDAGYLRPTMIIGFILQLLGIFMTSLSISYWQFILAQGICQGLGDGLLFCPMVAVMSTYFSKRRTLAISSAACGGATGGMVFPAIAQQLLPKIGFAWTVRVMGFVVLFNACVVLSLVRQRLPPRKTGPLIEWGAFTELPYVLFASGTFFALWATFYAYYYVRAFGRDILHISEQTSFNLLLIINGVGLPGRLIPALLSDKFFGPVNTIIPWTASASVLLYGWIGVHSLAGLTVFTAIYGFFGGGIQSLFPSALSSLTTDLSKAGTRIGMVFSIVSIATLTGPPLAGALIGKDDGQYLYAQLFGGTSMILGSLLLVGARVSQTGFFLKRRM
ncbi:hypothetical protein VTN00DRAFT_10041 [Thermoascus crustaceus]|uniref:uncharacterized protein n=1 Tax=Thermoascus crustaceus TaxID=5088 RepID=UPI003743C842